MYENNRVFTSLPHFMGAAIVGYEGNYTDALSDKCALCLSGMLVKIGLSRLSPGSTSNATVVSRK